MSLFLPGEEHCVHVLTEKHIIVTAEWQSVLMLMCRLHY